VPTDLIKMTDAGFARLRSRAGSVVAGRSWGNEQSVVEVHGWVKLVMRERGKIVPGSHREGHNVWTDTGREYVTQRMTPQLPGAPSLPYRADLISYFGVGTGSQLEEPTVLRLQEPISFAIGVFLAGIQAADFPLYPRRTSVRYQRTYAEEEISTQVGSTVLVGELGLFTNGDPDQNYDPGVLPAFDSSSTLAPVAYKTFEPVGKTTAMQLELSWEIRA
jgi:hypothetical protein